MGQALRAALPVPVHADDEGLLAAVGVGQQDDDVLERVGRGPRPIGSWVRLVEEVDKGVDGRRAGRVDDLGGRHTGVIDRLKGCLLYTSDAADERSSVDLGGRRIIKKKNVVDDTGCSMDKSKEEVMLGCSNASSKT